MVFLKFVVMQRKILYNLFVFLPLTYALLLPGCKGKAPVDEGEVVEDVKGKRTPEYVIKRKLMLYRHGIRIHEV